VTQGTLNKYSKAEKKLILLPEEKFSKKPGEEFPHYYTRNFVKKVSF